MPSIDLERTVAAPPERVFDLARSVDCHVETMATHDERAVDGVMTGLLAPGDRVTWRARHLGIPLSMTVEVTAMDRPRHFRDEQVAGPFAELVHDHRFEAVDSGTRLRDAFAFSSPAGPLGRVVDAVVLERYLHRLLERRARRLAAIAEGDDWRRFLE